MSAWNWVVIISAIAMCAGIWTWVWMIGRSVGDIERDL